VFLDAEDITLKLLGIGHSAKGLLKVVTGGLRCFMRLLRAPLRACLDLHDAFEMSGS